MRKSPAGGIPRESIFWGAVGGGARTGAGRTLLVLVDWVAWLTVCVRALFLLLGSAAACECFDDYAGSARLALKGSFVFPTIQYAPGSF